MPAGYYNQNEAPYCAAGSFVKDIPNWCNTTPYLDSNGHADGVINFVFTDCNTNKPLPMEYQAPPYRYPGVSTGPKV